MTPPRAEAVAALLAALRKVRDANEELAITAAWVLEAYGDTTDAETIRMLPVVAARPGRPAVPPPLAGPDSVTVTEDAADDETWPGGTRCLAHGCKPGLCIAYGVPGCGMKSQEVRP